MINVLILNIFVRQRITQGDNEKRQSRLERTLGRNVSR